MSEPMLTTFRGVEVRLVRSVQQESCAGCYFDPNPSADCPRDNKQQQYCFTETDDGGFAGTYDSIWIETTPEAMAKYATWRLDPGSLDVEDD